MKEPKVVHSVYVRANTASSLNTLSIMEEANQGT